MDTKGEIKSRFIIKLIGAVVGAVGFFIMAFGQSRFGTILVGIGTIIIAIGE